MNTEPQTAVEPNGQGQGRRGIARRMYDWVLSWADTPYGTPALAIISFVESSFFPIPPDVLQIALSAAKPRRAFFYATVSLIASVCGAVLGYYIGYALWAMVSDFFFSYVFSEDLFKIVENQYNENAFFAIFVAAFTPIPYKIFTVTAGVCKISLFTLLIASVIGRGGRFYLVALLIWLFGPGIKHFIEKYFELCVIVFTVLLIGGFMLIKLMVH